MLDHLAAAQGARVKTSGLATAGGIFPSRARRTAVATLRFNSTMEPSEYQAA
jgi:hypothetical protein